MDVLCKWQAAASNSIALCDDDKKQFGSEAQKSCLKGTLHFFHTNVLIMTILLHHHLEQSSAAAAANTKTAERVAAIKNCQRISQENELSS